MLTRQFVKEDGKWKEIEVQVTIREVSPSIFHRAVELRKNPAYKARYAKDTMEMRLAESPEFTDTQLLLLARG